MVHHGRQMGARNQGPDGHLSPLAKEMISQQAMENIDTLNLFTITVAEKAHCKDIALFGDDISVDGCDHCDHCGGK